MHIPELHPRLTESLLCMLGICILTSISGDCSVYRGLITQCSRTVFFQRRCTYCKMAQGIQKTSQNFLFRFILSHYFNSVHNVLKQQYMNMFINKDIHKSQTFLFFYLVECKVTKPNCKSKQTNLDIISSGNSFFSSLVQFSRSVMSDSW